jgi:hypothetical protein
MDTALDLSTTVVQRAGISENYCARNSGSPEVELRFVPWLILFKY